MKKIFLGLFLVLIIAAIGLYSQLNTIVKAGVETAGPQALKVPVTLEGINISPLSGKTTLKGLKIGQPDGFGDGTMAGIGELDVKLDPQSLLTDHVKVDYITVDAPLLDVRMLGGKTNFKALQDRLNMAPAPDTAESNLTLTIKKIKVKAPQLSVTSDGMLSGQKDVKLADFEITNLGTDEQGLAPREIARHVMDVLQPQIAKALIEMGASDKVQDLAGDAKGKLEKGLGGMLEKLKNKK